MFKKNPNKFNIRQFLVLLHDSVTNMKMFQSFDRFLKNFDVLLVAAAKNTATSLYNENLKKKCQNILNEENVKIKKQAYTFTGFASSYNVKI